MEEHAHDLTCHFTLSLHLSSWRTDVCWLSLAAYWIFFPPDKSCQEEKQMETDGHADCLWLFAVLTFLMLESWQTSSFFADGLSLIQRPTMAHHGPTWPVPGRGGGSADPDGSSLSEFGAGTNPGGDFLGESKSFWIKRSTPKIVETMEPARQCLEVLNILKYIY